jgi:uncharacterized protein YqgV (UPF0045/DUF77 family)
MKVSIEITLAPLEKEYETPIKDFIRVLRSSPFETQENPLSTQIYGDYDPLMLFLTRAIADSFDAIAAGMIHLKIVKSDRSKYQPFI